MKRRRLLPAKFTKGHEAILEFEEGLERQCGAADAAGEGEDAGEGGEVAGEVFWVLGVGCWVLEWV